MMTDELNESELAKELPDAICTLRDSAANLERTTLALLGVVLCFADFVSAADSSKNVNTYNQRTGAVMGK